MLVVACVWGVVVWGVVALVVVVCGGVLWCVLNLLFAGVRLLWSSLLCCWCVVVSVVLEVFFLFSFVFSRRAVP